MDSRPTAHDPGPSLPPLPPASREVLEVLWSADRPLRTRQIHDAVGCSHPHRAGRKINTTSSLLSLLIESGWVVGRKRGGTRWVYEAAVNRDAGMRQLARRAVEAFSVEPGDGWYLVWAALERLEVGERLSTRRADRDLEGSDRPGRPASRRYRSG